MLLAFLSRFMSSLLTALLFVIIVGTTANQTILNTGYIEHKLDSQNAYSRLSDGLSTQISKDSQDQTISQPAVASQLKTILTADVLKTKIDTTLKQLQDYYRGNGQVPALDLTDVMQQAQKSGLDIDGGKFDKPVKLQAATKLKKVSNAAKFVGIGTLVAVITLLFGILAIAIKRHNYKPLANIIFSLGIMLSVSGIVLLFVPQTLDKLHNFKTAGSLLSLVHDLFIVTVRDLGLRLLIPGITLLSLGILAKVALRRTTGKTPQPKKPKRIEAAEPLFLDNTVTDTPIPSVEIPSTPTLPAKPVVTDSVIPGAPPRPKRPRKIQL